MQATLKPLEQPNELFIDDPYIAAYGDAYKQQIELLRWHIVEGENGQEQFIVLDHEASVGKSVKSNKILKMYMDEWGNRRFLLVKRFKKDVASCVSTFDDCGVGEDVATGITSDNWREWKHRLHELESYPVLVITHERYKALCIDEHLRSYFKEGRHTLIIDEKMDFPIYTFSVEAFKLVLPYVPHQLLRLYMDVCEPLMIEIDRMGLIEGNNLKVVKSKPMVDDKLLASFLERMKENRKHINKEKRKDVFKFVEVIENCYNNTCFYNGGRISCFNKKHQLWGLENNIILDANGSIDHSYVIHPRIRLEKQKKLVNHCDSTIVWVKFNSGRSAIEKNLDEYYKEIAECIAANHELGDNTLVVSHKRHEKIMVNSLLEAGLEVVGSEILYDDEEVAVNHFGNLIGKNDYRDFNKCWLVGTPNIPMEQYVLKWYQYSEKKIRKECFTFTGRDNAMRFDDKEIDNMRVSHLAGEMYQCAKRIQRVCFPQGRFFIVTNTQDVFNMIAEQCLHIERDADPEKNLLVLPSVQKERSEKENNKADTKGSILAAYLLSLKSNKYSKKEIRESDEIRYSPATFTRVLKSSIEIKQLEQVGLITINAKTIIRH